MYERRVHALEDPSEIRRLILEYPWALLTARGENGVIASHLPCLLEPAEQDDDELVILSHVAKADPIVGALRGEDEALLVFQGPHGYVSPSWYGEGPHVGTWNFTAAHVYGVPELLEGDDAFRVLDMTQDLFENRVDEPVALDSIPDYARKIARATVPFRLRATRIQAKAKLSRDKPDEVQRRIVEALETPGPYENRLLAQDMRRLRER